MPRSASLELTFGALADPVRLAVIALLRKQPLRSGEIAQQLDLSRPQMSKHLQMLRKAGVVEELASGEDARARTYQLRSGAFSELRDWLEEIEALWTDQLQAFKAHAEARVAATSKADPRREAAKPVRRSARKGGRR